MILHVADVLCGKVEVGWLQHNDMCEFIPVDEWEKEGVSTLICEIQLVLRDMYNIKQTVQQSDYLLFRNTSIK